MDTFQFPSHPICMSCLLICNKPHHSVAENNKRLLSHSCTVVLGQESRHSFSGCLWLKVFLKVAVKAQLGEGPLPSSLTCSLARFTSSQVIGHGASGPPSVSHQVASSPGSSLLCELASPEVREGTQDGSCCLCNLVFKMTCHRFYHLLFITSH